MNGNQLFWLGVIITVAVLIVLLVTINCVRAIMIAREEQPVKIIQCKDLHHTAVAEADHFEEQLGTHGERTQAMPTVDPGRPVGRNRAWAD